MFAKGTVWQNSAFFFFGRVPFSPLHLHLCKGYMKRHVGWWKLSFYIDRWRWSEQKSTGHDLSKDLDLQASQRDKVQLRLSGTVLKNLCDPDSCPRLGSDFRTMVNAESKSFPEGTRCYSDPSEWLSSPVVEVNLCRSVENEYLFQPNIDHIQHLSLQKPAETQHNINFQKCTSSAHPHPLVRSSCADLKGRAERSLKLVALGRTQGVQPGWASLPEPAAPTITLCVWFGLGLQPPQALRLKSPQPSSMWRGEFW